MSTNTGGTTSTAKKRKTHEDGGRPGPTEEADPVSQLKREVQESPGGGEKRFRVRDIRADLCKEN